MGVVEVGETPSLTGLSVREAHRILESTQAHLHGNQHLKGHNLLVGSEVTKSRVRGNRVALLPL